MTSTIVKVINKIGLHARPASVFVQCANRFKSNITIRHNSNSYNGKSIMALLTAGICFDSEIEISAEGTDEKEAVGTLSGLISSRFGGLEED